MLGGSSHPLENCRHPSMQRRFVVALYASSWMRLKPETPTNRGVSARCKLFLLTVCVFFEAPFQVGLREEFGFRGSPILAHTHEVGTQSMACDLRKKTPETRRRRPNCGRERKREAGPRALRLFFLALTVLGANRAQHHALYLSTDFAEEEAEWLASQCKWLELGR